MPAQFMKGITEGWETNLTLKMEAGQECVYVIWDFLLSISWQVVITWVTNIITTFVSMYCMYIQ